MNLKTVAERAVFQVDGKPDTEVEVKALEVDGELQSFAFTINYNDDSPGVVLALDPCTGRQLQIAESLQFAADCISRKIEGRLSPFVRGWGSLAAEVHYVAKGKGFWEDGIERNDGEMLCLIHSEISEALEALREGNPPDAKIPEFESVEVELADAVIRIMDLSHARGWRVGQAIEAKLAYNRSRPHKHGKQF